MVGTSGTAITEHFASLDDPRIDRTKRHKHLDIVTIAICGTICGADNWVDIELFGKCNEEWFKSFLELPNDIPSHDTFGDVFARTVNKSHGRLETRQCWVITDPDCLDYLQTRQQWAKHNAVVKVTAHRETVTKTAVQSRYYISSLTGQAKSLLDAIRRHSGIENSLHWSLDVTFREDQSRVRKDHGPQNLAVLRQIALNLLKEETTLNGVSKVNGLKPDGSSTTS